MDAPRHAHALHQGPSLGASRRRGTQTEPGGVVSNPPDDSLQPYLARRDAANQNATKVYAALKSTGKLSAQRLLAYRCRAKGCLVLDIIQVPGQMAIHQPRYKRSPERNLEASN